MGDYKRLFRLWAGKRSAEDEMDEEIDAHLRLSAEAFVRRGATPEEARRMAEARFGNLGRARNDLRAGARERETTRRQRDVAGALLADLRFAFTQMRRAPGFTALAILTLALGIGLTTATFILVNGVLLQPLPLHRPEQLVELFSRDSAGRDIEVVSTGNLADWVRGSSTLAGATIHIGRPMTIGLGDETVRVPGELVGGNYFEVLRPRLLLGRAFTADEVARNELVVVISEGMWRQLGADSSLRRPVRIEGIEHQVIGVVQAGSEYPAGTAIWGGVQPPPETGAMRNNVNWLGIGRLKEGVSIELARNDLARAALEVRQRIPEALYSYGVGVSSLQSYVVGDTNRMLTLLMMAVSAVLLVACANLAAANLSRGAGRSREFAVRVALGAGRGRLVQQVLIEQLSPSFIGGALGAWAGWVAVRAVLATWASEIPRASEVTFDFRVLVFATGLSILAGTLAGLAPALRSSQVNPAAMLVGGNRLARGGRGLPGASLIAIEIALAFALLTGAGLLLRSFGRLLDRELGYSSDVVTAEAGLPLSQFRSEQDAAAFWEAALQEVRSVPGVEAVGVGTWIPLSSGGQTFLEVSGLNGATQGASYRAVGGDYFAALRIPLLLGRYLDAGDGPGATRVAVINRRMAEKYWPGQSAIGHQIRALSMERTAADPAPWLTIVGVVGDVRHYGRETEPEPEMYVDYRQMPRFAYSMTIVARGRTASAQLVPDVRQKLHRLDSRVGFVMGTLDDRLERTLANRRFMMSVLTGFSVLALVLAAIGLYAVLAYSVSRRTRELAVRTALGATQRQLLQLVFASAGRVVIAGVVLGLIAAFFLSRSMQLFLVDLKPLDPVAFGLAAAVLIVIATIATMIPAIRATRTQPSSALQQE